MTGAREVAEQQLVGLGATAIFTHQQRCAHGATMITAGALKIVP